MKNSENENLPPEIQCIPKRLRDDVLAHVRHVIPTLKRERFTVRQMYDRFQWSLLYKAETSDAGVYVAYLVAHGELPLVDVGKDSRNHKIYRRK